MNQLTFDTPAQYCQYLGIEPQHPLVAVQTLPSPPDKINDIAMCRNFYCVYLKQTKGCQINYGKTIYDYDDQTIVCFAPGQIVTTIHQPRQQMPQAIGLYFHPDLLFRTPLASKIRQYSFFSYDSHEALHLSPDERQNIEECMARIEKELRHPVDRFSKNLIVSNIELLLDYCLRYYTRQFEIREVLNEGIMTKFDDLLHTYVNDPQACASGLPNVKYFADQLALSPNYFGDLVKRQAGITAQEYIQNKLLGQAKILLLNNRHNVSQTAYTLGFQYPQHFIRFFKRKTGQTPREFINSN